MQKSMIPPQENDRITWDAFFLSDGHLEQLWNVEVFKKLLQFV